MRAEHLARALGLLGAVMLPFTAAGQSDWTPIEYPDGTGCGLYVQFLTADGWEPLVNGKPTGFFPGGAPPGTSEAACRAKCDEWARSGTVRSLAAAYRTSVFITQVRGTCFLRRKALAPPRVLDVP